MAKKSQTPTSAVDMFDYAPAPESRAVVDIKSSYGLFIGGDFVDPVGGTSFKTISPATEEVLAEVAEASDEDVDLAVKAARRAYTRVWSKMSGRERGKYLFRIARIIQERSREIAVLESIDNGKPIKESRDVDVPTAAAHFFYYAGWADKLEHAGLGPDPQPLGVAGQVIPWNFPFLMLSWKIAPALAAGNTVVLKPAETTPLTALLFAEICQQADLPPGVVNIITGAGSTGQALVAHRDVDKVAFTGSTDVGKAIARTVAGTSKSVTLELGGKAANIVFDDAPVDQAIEGIVNGIFFNQGHVCCAGSRLLVQESVAEEVLDRLKRRMGTLRVGDPLDKNTDIGAINSAEQLARIKELSDIGESEGAGRWSPACDLPSQGFWFPPTIFTGVSQA
ncbi:MAG: aldehyde dehydrogenase family protein, partial [Nocardioides sp.]